MAVFEDEATSVDVFLEPPDGDKAEEGSSEEDGDGYLQVKFVWVAQIGIEERCQ